MIQDATGYRGDILDGRWVIEARRRHRPWEVIVEPAVRERLLIVITAYEVKR